jgi:3-oxoadipate CoA-transferase beta subunit
VGGAMDLVAGVKSVYVITQHCTKTGDPKLIEACTYPLTGPGVVNRIYTDLAVIDITAEGFQLVELSPGVSFEYVAERTGAKLIPIS